MKVVNVIPLRKGPLRGDLTYFTAQEVPVGSIVSVPFKSKEVLGIVTSAEDVADTKGDIKEMPYDLRRVVEVKEKSIFRKEFLATVREVSKYFATSINNTIATLVPTIFREKYDEIPSFTEKKETKVSGKEIRPEKLLFQEDLKDRISSYKTLIREAFAQRKSVYIVLPTERDIKDFYDSLSKGIEQFIFTLHSGMSKAKTLETLKKALALEHSILILGTAPFLCTPRNDIGTIILEHESSTGYRVIGNPQLDLRVFVEVFASKIRAKFILGDSLLRLETLARKDIEGLASPRPLSFRVNFGGEISILKKIRDRGREFRVISDTGIGAIKKTLERGKNVFVFALRKGLATMTVCRDCGEILSCTHCRAPMVLYPGSRDKRMFLCNKCGLEMGTDSICQSCGGWNLAPMGIGTDTVLEELKKHFPKKIIFKLDRESAKSKTGAKKIIRDWQASEGGILVGTEMALFYLNEPVPLSLIASFDSLWSIPNYKMTEKVTHLLLSILKNTKNELIIETKNTEDHAILAIKSGNLGSFVREELEARKNLNYPPHRRFIKITHLGDKEKTKSAREFLKETFSAYKPEIFSGFHPRLKGKFVTNALLRVGPKNWSVPEILSNSKINEDLHARLISLPQSYQITVDPEDLL